MGKGNHSNWSYVYVGSRPRTILKITEAVEAAFKQFFGFSGKSADGTPVNQFFVTTDATSVDLTTLTDLPVGTIIFTPKVSAVFCYQRVAQATAGASVDADWVKIAKATI